MTCLNPLPPRGGRQVTDMITAEGIKLKSTPSSRRETVDRIDAEARRKLKSTPSSRRETLHRREDALRAKA